MSGTEIDISILDDFMDFINDVTMKFKEIREKKRMEREQKRMIRRIINNINKTNERELERIANQANEQNRDRLNELSRNKRELSERKSELNIELNDTIMELNALNEEVRHNDFERRAELYERIEQLEQDRARTEQELNDLKNDIDAVNRDIEAQINDIQDRIYRDEIYPLTRDIDGRSDALAEKIVRYIKDDPYCRYSFTAALKKLEELRSDEVNAENYMSTRESLVALDVYVDEKIRQTENGYRSAAIIETMERSVKAMSDDDDRISVRLEGNYNDVRTITIDFGRDISHVYISPDGNGSVKTVILNEVDDGGDSDVHKEKCEYRTRQITRAIKGSEYNDYEISYGNEIQRPSRRSNEEIYNESMRELDNRIGGVEKTRI